MIRHIALGLACFMVGASGGCAGLGKGRLPETVITAIEPALGREYLLYRPVTYTRDQHWPLVIACYGGLGDSPSSQIKKWQPLADRYGILVAAPTLLAGSDPEKMLDDERHILSVVSHVQGSQSVSEDRILMYGQGASALTALTTAVGAPELFRAIALSDPRLRVEELTATKRSFDPYQRIFVRYKATDIAIGKHVQSSMDWLRSNGANLQADVFGGRDPAITLQRVVEFYQNAIRTEAWVHLRAQPSADDDKTYRFEARSSVPLQDVHWQFGDGAESRDAQPVHKFQTPGTYRIQLSARHQKNQLSRSMALRVPADKSALSPTQVP